MFEDDNLDDLDIGLEDLPSSRMGRSPFAFPFQGSPSPTAFGSLFWLLGVSFFPIEKFVTLKS